MKKKSESQIQTEIIKYLEDKGYYVIKIVRANKQGVSDIAVCADGKFIAIEVKATGKKKTVTHLQKFHLELVTMSGGKAFVADSVWDVMEEGRIALAFSTIRLSWRDHVCGGWWTRDHPSSGWTALAGCRPTTTTSRPQASSGAFSEAPATPSWCARSISHRRRQRAES